MQYKTALAFTCLAVGATGCGGTTAGNPLISLDLGGYSSASTDLMSWLIQPAYAAGASQIKLCFKRVRFKADTSSTTDPTSAPENLDFAPGEVTVSATGTPLGKLKVPAGVYLRVEFDLAPDCPSGKSIALVNDYGSFSTSDTVSIRFDGMLMLLRDGQAVKLGVQPLVTQLAKVTSDGDIKNDAEETSGEADD